MFVPAGEADGLPCDLIASAGGRLGDRGRFSAAAVARAIGDRTVGIGATWNATASAGDDGGEVLPLEHFSQNVDGRLLEAPADAPCGLCDVARDTVRLELR